MVFTILKYIGVINYDTCCFIHEIKKESKFNYGQQKCSVTNSSTPMKEKCLHKILPDAHPPPMCPLCNTHTHNANHLFTCQHIHTILTPISLWEDPVGVADLLSRWCAVLAWGLDRPRHTGERADITNREDTLLGCTNKININKKKSLLAKLRLFLFFQQ